MKYSEEERSAPNFLSWRLIWGEEDEDEEEEEEEDTKENA